MATSPRARSLICIEGDTVRLVSEQVVQEVNAETFLRELSREQPIASGPLPQGGCYYRKTNSNNQIVSLFVIERPASTYGFKFRFRAKSAPEADQKDDENNRKTYTVSWPHMLFMYRCVGNAFTHCYMVASRSPLVDLYEKTPIYLTLMPNTYNAGHANMCTGSMPEPIDVSRPLAEGVAKLHAHLLCSEWNRDLIYNYPQGCGITNLQDWHKKTEEDPGCWRSINFPLHADATFGTLVQRMLGVM